MEPIQMIPLASGNPARVSQWRDICTKQQRSLDHWREQMINGGIKAAHPDDGWVDRAASTVQFVYPYFNLGAVAGDLVALGDERKHRIVRLVEHVPNRFDAAANRWRFEELSAPR
jgi:hypothetical protein